MSLHENHVKENLHELNFNQIPYLQIKGHNFMLSACDKIL